jgi:hypothetical protein
MKQCQEREDTETVVAEVAFGTAQDSLSMSRSMSRFSRHPLYKFRRHRRRNQNQNQNQNLLEIQQWP